MDDDRKLSKQERRARYEAKLEQLSVWDRAQVEANREIRQAQRAARKVAQEQATADPEQVRDVAERKEPISTHENAPDAWSWTRPRLVYRKVLRILQTRFHTLVGRRT